MKVIIALNHPAQYHLFKNIAIELQKKQHHICFAVKSKDILEDLLNKDNVPFVRVSQKKKAPKFKLGVLFFRFSELLFQYINLAKLARSFKPDIMIGTDMAISLVGKLFGIPSVVYNEDDFEINKLFCKFSYPFATHIFSPSVCDVGKYSAKKISYSGYQKLAYLHPNRFKPDSQVRRKYIKEDDNYFIIRLVSFTAGHDVEAKHEGFNENLLLQVISILEPHGKVFITSETNLNPQLAPYKLNINPTDIHHLLYYSSLFIGDSQSMCVEAAMLGTPSIRFNSFAGKISVLEELEKKYTLTFGIPSTQPAKLLTKLKELLEYKNIREKFQEKRKNMLSDKIDLTAFSVWFIENYPQSIDILSKDPDYQNRFK
jgi:predicted glycosyltransferase